jgi:peptidoglycan L-alanyl-D-glutamate endopeptidase CwlK
MLEYLGKERKMFNFGKRSRSRLDTCHPDLIMIMEEAIKVFDFSILEGIRTTEKQQEYFETGRSKLDGIHKLSKHQDHGDGLSYAIDIMPYAKGENAFSGQPKDIARFYCLGGIVKMAAFKLLQDGKISHGIRWGADWNSNNLFNDQNFDDLPHFELI